MQVFHPRSVLVPWSPWQNTLASPPWQNNATAARALFAHAGHFIQIFEKSPFHRGFAVGGETDI